MKTPAKLFGMDLVWDDSMPAYSFAIFPEPIREEHWGTPEFAIEFSECQRRALDDTLIFEVKLVRR